MSLPKLASVPSCIGFPLEIKATTSGITFLKQSSFRSRYTGNKFYAVDINGSKIWEKSELIKEVYGEKKPKKKARVETQADYKNIFQCEQVQISGKLSTLLGAISTIRSELSTKKEKSYSVHKREVRQRLLGFMNTQAGKKELYFWTVTFPAGVSDKIAYQIFNTWLTRLRQLKMLKNYLWVAERQKIGTIHFHIAIPHKMYVKRANAMMAGTLKTFSKRGDIPVSVFQCKRYNGVDIAKNRNTGRVTNFAIKKGNKALIGYLTKYVTKNDASFSHLAWHNSRGFSSIFTGVTFTIPEFVGYGFNLLLNRQKIFSTEFFTFVPWLNDPPPLLVNHLYKINSFTQNLN